MRRIAVIGLFCEGKEVADGQSIKTRIVAHELTRAVGEENIQRIDTFGWRKNPFRLFVKCINAVWHSDHVIFMTDEGGIKVFPWLLTLSNFMRKCRIHYVVIGGWLNQSLETRKLRRYWLKKLDGIYVETNTMKTGLEGRGLKNIVLLPNCKELKVVTEDELRDFPNKPYPLCTFSRVMKEKGIDDAVKAVHEINRRAGESVFTLDIYGQVDPKQQDWFDELKAEFRDGVQYRGIIPYSQSTEVLNKYFALLFPTKLFHTEGVPGTIIDTYAAGVPVIASRWESISDILDDETSMIYAAGSYEGLLDCLQKAANDPSIINGKRSACLKRANMYAPENVMKILLDHLK